MSELTKRVWVEQEKSTFLNFKPDLAEHFENAHLRSIIETLRRKLKKYGEGTVDMPWGTFGVKVVTKGETGVITPYYEPSKGFIKALNGDFDDSPDDSSMTQEEFDPTFVKLYKDYLAYNTFDPELPENKDKIVKTVKVTDDEVNYFLNSWAKVLVTIAKDKQREGKVFRLEVDNTFPFGTFTFEYDDDEIKVSFVFNKSAKQILKDDEVAARPAASDFTPIPPNTTRIQVFDAVSIKDSDEDMSIRFKKADKELLDEDMAIAASIIGTPKRADENYHSIAAAQKRAREEKQARKEAKKMKKHQKFHI